jgi:hypothetical protein
MDNTFKKDRELFSHDDPRKNASGCDDPTAYEAIKNIDEEEESFKKLLRVIRYICGLAGFEIQGRVVFKNKNSGRVWK